MPHIWTHILFSEDVIDTVAKPYTNSEYEAYMKLGAQGPNPFFHSGFKPWTNKESVHEVHKSLHETNSGLLLIDFIKSAKDSCNEVKAFVSGFITHHILDRRTHPFIHAFAKRYDKEKREFEIIIDTLLMDKLSNLKAWKTPAYKEIDIGKHIDENIVNLLYTTTNKYYPELKKLKKKHIQKTYRDMLFSLKIAQDPYGMKKFFFGSLLSSYSHQPINQKIDYLNSNKQLWHHPVTKEESIKSFMELYNEARIKSIDIVTEVQNYWKDESSYSMKKIAEMIESNSHYLAAPIETEVNYKHKEAIW